MGLKEKTVAEWREQFKFGMTNGDFYISGRKDTAPVMVIPGKIGKNEVFGIRKEAFCGCDTVKEVILSEGIKFIGKKAFAYCYNLQSISLPESISVIESSAFDGCHQLQSVHITSIKNWCKIKFSECKDEEIGNPVSYAHSLYVDNQPITVLTIPEGVVRIEKYTFSDLKDLVEIRFPESLRRICTGAFAGCSNLRSITVPEGVRTIESDAFARCTKLKEITISPKTTVNAHAFAYCPSWKQ